eukprot:ANDGO_07569.mRNA.1 Chaperone protein DnaJ
MAENRRSYYSVLGVEQDASPEVIRRAFLTLSRRLHPDKRTAPSGKQQQHQRAAAGAAAGGEEGVEDEREEEGGETGREMALVNEAYEVLRDADRRRMYDLYGSMDGNDLIGMMMQKQQQEARLSAADVASYMKKREGAAGADGEYVLSAEEEKDVEEHFVPCKGSMARLRQVVVGLEKHSRKAFERAIAQKIAIGTLPDLDTFWSSAKYVNRPSSTHSSSFSSSSSPSSSIRSDAATQQAAQQDKNVPYEAPHAGPKPKKHKLRT